MSNRSRLSKTFVWILLGLLFVGLAGFGATNLSGTVRTVARVGDETVSVDSFARALQQERNAIIAQTGQALPMEQLRAFGLDNQVLSQLVTLAAMDHEAAAMGLSIGDANLQREILQIPTFQSLDGTFDREAYRFALEQAGLDEAEFETDLRKEAARTLIQSAILGGTRMPDTLTDLLVEHIGQRRSFTWARLSAEDLAQPLPALTEDDLRAHYEANIDAYTLPETKRITYAFLTPEAILDSVEVDETALRDAYEARAAEFNQPERRLVERLVFADETAARDAQAQLEVGGTSFERLVEDRGLALSDIDLGDVTADDLGAAGAEVFAARVGAVVGPLPSDLGPALFRVNARLQAIETPFDAARPLLRDDLAQDRARRQLEVMREDFEDLLAGGATLEDMAAETEMDLGRIDWHDAVLEGIAAYDAFRDAAGAVTAEDFPQIDFLDDGGLFALRLDETLPPRPEPFDAVRVRLRTDARRAATARALREQAEALLPRITGAGDFVQAGLAPNVETEITRARVIDGLPPLLVQAAFDIDTAGQVRVLDDGDTVFVLRLDTIAPAARDGEMAELRAALSAQLDQTLAQALFQAFVRDVRQRAEPRVDERALNAVLSGFQ